jgi:hypothetical protein
MPQFRVIIEKKDLLTVIIEDDTVKDAIKTATKLIGKNYPSKESSRVIEGREVRELPLSISIIGAPEVLEKTKKKFVIKTSGN